MPSGGEARHDVATGLQPNGFRIELTEGFLHIRGLDVLQIEGADGKDAIGHGGDDAIAHELLDPAGIAEVGHLLAEREVDGALHLGIGLGGEDVLIALQQSAGDLHELIG